MGVAELLQERSLITALLIAALLVALIVIVYSGVGKSSFMPVPAPCPDDSTFVRGEPSGHGARHASMSPIGFGIGAREYTYGDSVRGDIIRDNSIREYARHDANRNDGILEYAQSDANRNDGIQKYIHSDGIQKYARNGGIRSYGDSYPQVPTVRDGTVARAPFNDTTNMVRRGLGAPSAGVAAYRELGPAPEFGLGRLLWSRELAAGRSAEKMPSADSSGDEYRLRAGTQGTLVPEDGADRPLSLPRWHLAAAGAGDGINTDYVTDGPYGPTQGMAPQSYR